MRAPALSKRVALSCIKPLLRRADMETSRLARPRPIPASSGPALRTRGFSMPNRTIRDGLRSSEQINLLSDAAERLFTRLLISADDYGLIEMSAAWVKAHAVPLLDWTFTTVAKYLAELVDHGLLLPYQAENGRQYAAMAKWEQRIEAKYPKFPMPPWGREHIRGGLDRSGRVRDWSDIKRNRKLRENTHWAPTGHPLGTHLAPTPEERGTRNEEKSTTCHSTEVLCDEDSTSVTDDTTVATAPMTDRASRSNPVAREKSYPEQFEEVWAEYPKRAGGNSKVAACKAWKARIASGVSAAVMLDGVRRYRAYLTSSGKVGTEYVKQASTFFGPAEHYLETFEKSAPSRSRQEIAEAEALEYYRKAMAMAGL